MTIALGTPFTADKLATKIDTYNYELNKGAFTGAERIEVMVTDNGLVQTLIFVYPQGVTVRRVIDSYRTTLGEPETIDPSGTERGFFWSDGLTRFEVLQPNADSGPVISRLINQAVTVPPKWLNAFAEHDELAPGATRHCIVKSAITGRCVEPSAPPTKQFAAENSELNRMWSMRR